MAEIKIPSPEKMQKYPWATTVVSLFAVCVLLLYFILKKPNEDGCEDEKKQLRIELTQARADKDALTTALLVKNGIILQQAQDKKELDSTIRTTVGTKAKKILKEE